jgi:pimeloyl-ACP methyl ester carboxylesterase
MTLTTRESAEVAAANESGKQPVVFVHGLWLLPVSWSPWRALFEEQGYATLAPGWPDDPVTVEQARAKPEVFAGKGVGQITDHHAEVIRGLNRKPIVIGHSFGGLITQKLAGEGLAAGAVAIDPAPFRGVLPLPISSLRSAFPVLGNPLNRKKAITLTEQQFRYGWTHALSAEESAILYAQHHVAAPAKPLFQAAFANFNPRSETKVNTKQRHRGPLLIISGEQDHTVPWAIANASYKRWKHNESPTEITEIKGRTHSLVIDSGWYEVAETAIAFLQAHGLRADSQPG